jgi:hypothetical protein
MRFGLIELKILLLTTMLTNICIIYTELPYTKVHKIAHTFSIRTELRPIFLSGVASVISPSQLN